MLVPNNGLAWVLRFTLPLIATVCGCTANLDYVTHDEKPASSSPIVGKRLSNSDTFLTSSLPADRSTDNRFKDKKISVKENYQDNSASHEVPPRPSMSNLTSQSNKHNILFVGDSHVAAAFGKTLTDLLANDARETSVTTVSSCGSSPLWWLSGKPTTCGLWKRDADGGVESSPTGTTPLISKLIASLNPDTIIVGLGTNLIPEDSIERRKRAEKLMRIVTANGLQCFWIGPPDARKFTAQQIEGVYATLTDYR